MSAAAPSPFPRLTENAFYVLGLPPTATRQEVEREGQKLLAMLELGLAEAQRYATPLGTATRTAEAVRAAMAALREPATRFQHELWAQLPPDTAPRPESTPAAGTPWPEAVERLGWARGGG